MKNETVAERFAQGRSASTNHMFIRGNTVYSYGEHFPIAINCEDYYLFNSKEYSQSTACHKSLVRNAIEGKGIPIIEIANCDLANAQTQQQTATQNQKMWIR